MESQLLISLLALAAVLGGCATPPSSGPPSRGPGTGAERSAPRRITAAFMGEVVTMNARARGTGPGIGTEVLEEMVSARLAILDGQGNLHPLVAEQVPSVENRLWKVFPDGRMETTWRIRAGARWHDGMPFTSADLLFTTKFDQDREIPFSRDIAYESVESIEAPDPGTFTVRWKRPFIEADRFPGVPLPQHILEPLYTDDKPNILQHPYWTAEFVSNGPFKLREFALGSHLILEAYDQYVMGRPRIDEIDVRFIPDSNALVANILAGAVEMTLGHSLSIEQAIQVRDLWRDGQIQMGPGNWVTIHPQLLNPTPPIVANLQFRRALLHAIDRQHMADTLQFGLTQVAHSYLNPNQPQYRDIEAALPRYEYDPRQAVQMIEALGYTRGPNGIFRPDSSGPDASSQRLSVELRTTAQYDVQRGSMLAVADYWQRVGVATDTLMVATQRQRDPEYRAAFPAFELLNGPPSDIRGLAGLHSSRARVPANNFVGSNYSRYVNPEFDALLERYFLTIPKEERIQALGQIIYHIADQLVSMGLFYNDRPILISNRVGAVAAPKDRQATQAWNAHEWDIRG